MKRFVPIVVVFALLLNTLPGFAKTSRAGRGDERNDAGTVFGEILDLWRNGNYDELWRRTTSTGRQSKESFIGKLSSAGHRPACCWEKMQDVAVTSSDEHKATVQAKVGLEGLDGSTEYVTKRFKMVKEDGLWKISVSDVLSLAENGKKKSRRHYGGKKQNITIYPSR